MKKTCALSIILLVVLSCKNENTTKAIDSSNNNGQLTEIITRTFSIKLINNEAVIDTLQQMQSVTINHFGKEIENTYYNLDLTPSWVDKYKYDESGNKIGSEYFEKGDNQTIYYKYSNDSLGRRISYEAFDLKTDTLLYNGASRYENNGLLKKDGYVNKKSEFRWNFEYMFDEDGNELGYVYIDLQSGKRYPAEYNYVEFNQNKDWTKRMIIENGIVQSIETREFVEK